MSVEDDRLEDDGELGSDEERETLGRRSGVVGFVGGLVLGALIGAGITLLVAPERGRVVRRRLKRRFRRVREDAERGYREMKHDVQREARQRRGWLARAVKGEEA